MRTRGLSRGGFVLALTAVCALCMADLALGAPDPDLMRRWVLSCGWQLDSSAGRSGDPALVWQSASGTVGSSSRTVGLEPGVSYRLTAWVQAEALTNGGFAVSLEWRDPQQRYIGGKKVQEVINNDVGMIGGWRRYEAVTEPIPTDAVRSTLKVETTGKAEGRLSVCGITLEPTATKWMEFLSSSAYRDTAWEGTVRFAAPLFVNEVRHPLPTVGCELAYADGAGRAAVAKPVVFTAAEAVFELPVRNLKPGRQELVARIFDRRSDKTFESCKLAFTRTATAPKRAVWLDAKGRTLLNGKPFFPLGMYTSCKFMGEADFARWERSPFNFAMEYSHMMKPEHLDLYQKAGIYVAPDIRGLVYTRSCGGKDGPKDLETAHRLVREFVRMSASHPALIAWYMVDEAPAAWFPALAEMRNFLHETDPDHPVWAVHDHSRVARGLLPCCDVIGMDPYPIGNGGRGERGAIALVSRWPLEARRAMFDFRPMWQVPQAYNWAWHPSRATRTGAHFPTREEMSNMNWQGVAAGANGLCLYSYFDLVRHYSGDEFERVWRQVCDCAADVKKMIPVLLADGAPPRASDYPEDRLVVRTFRQDKTDWALVVNRTIEPVRATVRLPYPVRGVRTEVGGGVDAAADGSLSVDFRGLDVAFVALVPSKGKGAGK